MYISLVWRCYACCAVDGILITAHSRTTACAWVFACDSLRLPAPQLLMRWRSSAVAASRKACPALDIARVLLSTLPPRLGQAPRKVCLQSWPRLRATIRATRRQAPSPPPPLCRVEGGECNAAIGCEQQRSRAVCFTAIFRHRAERKKHEARRSRKPLRRSDCYTRDALSAPAFASKGPVTARVRARVVWMWRWRPCPSLAWAAIACERSLTINITYPYLLWLLLAPPCIQCSVMCLA